ncbi:MAG TPA: helix-turn-helix domain-containing protein [Actinomycetota bacterium]|nr:helix-turn-helix domain-containing protein [Actinomycetota bacterium]
MNPTEEPKEAHEMADLNGRLTLSVEEAAIALGISRSHAWRMVSNGTLPSVRIGHRVLVPVPDLQESIARARSRTTGQAGDGVAQEGRQCQQLGQEEGSSAGGARLGLPTGG